MLRYLISLAVALTVTLAALEERYVEINLAEVEPGRCSDLRIDLPLVCGVNFTGINNSDNSVFMEYSVDEYRNASMNFTTALNFTTTMDQQLAVHLTFNDNSSKIACQQYIFNRSLTSPLSFQCHPVQQCDEQSLDGDENIQTWKRFLSENDVRDFIDTPTNATATHNGDPLILTSNTDASLGYYVPFLPSSDSTILPGQVFAVYLNPVFTNDDDRNYSVVEGKNTDAVACSVRSFPPATVTWEFDRTLAGLDENDTAIVSEPGREFMNIDRSDFRLTIDGKIVIMSANTSDHGFYRCTAVNEASGNCTIRTRILRVRDKLRSLWPSLGFVFTILSVAVIIMVNYLIEKHRGEKKLPLEDDDFDGDTNDRHYSVSDPDSPNSSQSNKEHEAIRRVSSARQELLPNS